jgi:hypothetical protein
VRGEEYFLGLSGVLGVLEEGVNFAEMEFPRVYHYYLLFWEGLWGVLEEKKFLCPAL